MSAFPETSMTLLKKIAVQVTGEREAAWVRFFGLYEPAIKRFVAYHDSTHDPDDVVQDIFLKLVNIVCVQTGMVALNMSPITEMIRPTPQNIVNNILYGSILSDDEKRLIKLIINMKMQITRFRIENTK